MKTSEYWLEQWDNVDTLTRPSWIEQIQADAYQAGLLRAAQVCRSVAKQGGLASEVLYIQAIEHEANPHHDQETT